MTVAVTAPQNSVEAGGTLQLTATVTGDGPTTVGWSVNGISSGNSAYGTISTTGLYTAPAAVSTDLSVAVTATSLANTSVSATVALLVVAPTITSVAVVCNPASILTTGTSKCSAAVQGTGNYNPVVTWTATNGTISSAGVFTPSAAGNATISATSVQDATRIGSTAVTINPVFTVTGVTLSCSSLVVPVGQTSQCSASVQGTGAITRAVVWEVNGVEGGTSTIGTISASGLYQAPATAPSPYVVAITATSAEDATKSAWLSITIEGPIDSGTQTIGPAGGTITLADGSSVTIPANVLQADTAVTLSSSTVAIKPTNTLFQGIGPSLSLSFDPALTATGLEQRQRRLLSRAKSLDSSTSSALTFIVNGDPSSSAAQIQGAIGVVNVNNGTNNYFSLPSTYDSTLNQTTLTVDTSLLAANSSISVGLANIYECDVKQVGNAQLQQWDHNQGAFVDVTGTCQAGEKALVMVNGILSCPNGSFAQGSSPAAGVAYAPPPGSPNLDYGTSIFAIEYSWLQHIHNSAQSVANILDTLVGPNCPNKSFDIEAHSLGRLCTSPNPIPCLDKMISRG